MRSKVLLAALLVACGGGGGGPSEPQPQPQRGVVQGAIRDDADAGVAGVGVQLTRAGATALSATTSADGAYSFSAVDAGTWTLSGTPPAGFEAVGTLSTTVQVVGNQTTTVPVLRVRRVQQPGPGTVTLVTIQDAGFSPASVTVPVGRTVRWTNAGQLAHNSTSTTGAWASPTLAAGQSFEHTFQAAGTYTYSCTLHAGMNGTVVVQP